MHDGRRRCLICDGDDVRERDACVAPFLARRIWDRRSFRAQLIVCLKCGVSYFVPRLSGAEEHRLYHDYRGVEYQAMRQRCEPWYNARFNAGLEDPELVTLRQSLVRKLLIQYLGYAPQRILDFGGNRGELVAGLVEKADAFVYDISKKDATDQVLKLSNITECVEAAVDTIICSNVLEHVSAPRALLREIAPCAQGASVLFEVPVESNYNWTTRLKRTVQLAILLAMRPSIGIQLLALGNRPQMHEHVNFFTPSSLRALLHAEKWHISSQGTYNHGGIWIGPFQWQGTIAWAIASPQAAG